MFTIKLYTKENNNEVTTNILCCNNYSTLKGLSYCELTIYSDYTTQNGTTYKMSKDLETHHFTGYTVLNQAGKVVDSF